MENEEEILKKYKLSEEEHDHYYEIIKRAYTAGKTPSENPKTPRMAQKTPHYIPSPPSA